MSHSQTGYFADRQTGDITLLANKGFYCRSNNSRTGDTFSKNTIYNLIPGYQTNAARLINILEIAESTLLTFCQFKKSA